MSERRLARLLVMLSALTLSACHQCAEPAEEPARPAALGERAPVSAQPPPFAPPSASFAFQQLENDWASLEEGQRELVDRYLARENIDRAAFGDWVVELNTLGDDHAWFEERVVGTLEGWTWTRSNGENRELRTRSVLLGKGLEDFVASGDETGRSRSLAALHVCAWGQGDESFAPVEERERRGCVPTPPIRVHGAWPHLHPARLLMLLYGEGRLARVWDGPQDTPDDVNWHVPTELHAMRIEGGLWTGFGVLKDRVVTFEMNVGHDSKMESFASDSVGTF